MMHRQRNVKLYNKQSGKFKIGGSYEKEAPDFAHNYKRIFVMCL